LILKLVNKGYIESVPFRDGRHLYKKLRLQFKNLSPELQKQLNEMRKREHIYVEKSY